MIYNKAEGQLLELDCPACVAEVMLLLSSGTQRTYVRCLGCGLKTVDDTVATMPTLHGVQERECACDWCMDGVCECDLCQLDREFARKVTWYMENHHVGGPVTELATSLDEVAWVPMYDMKDPFAD